MSIILTIWVSFLNQQVTTYSINFGKNISLFIIFYLMRLSSSLDFSPSAYHHHLKFSLPSAAASAPSAASPSAASAGFSGSLTTVGAATVAITKSLP